MVHLRNLLNHNFEQDKNTGESLNLRDTDVCKREQEVLEKV